MVEFWSNFGQKMKFPKSIQDNSGKVPGPSGHEKTSKGWQNIHLEAYGQFPKIDSKSGKGKKKVESGLNEEDD